MTYRVIPEAAEAFGISKYFGRWFSVAEKGAGEGASAAAKAGEDAAASVASSAAQAGKGAADEFAGMGAQRALPPPEAAILKAKPDTGIVDGEVHEIPGQGRPGPRVSTDPVPLERIETSGSAEGAQRTSQAGAKTTGSQEAPRATENVKPQTTAAEEPPRDASAMKRDAAPKPDTAAADKAASEAAAKTAKETAEKAAKEAAEKAEKTWADTKAKMSSEDKALAERLDGTSLSAAEKQAKFDEIQLKRVEREAFSEPKPTADVKPLNTLEQAQWEQSIHGLRGRAKADADLIQKLHKEGKISDTDYATGVRQALGGQTSNPASPNGWAGQQPWQTTSGNLNAIINLFKSVGQGLDEVLPPATTAFRGRARPFLKMGVAAILGYAGLSLETVATPKFWGDKAAPTELKPGETAETARSVFIGRAIETVFPWLPGMAEFRAGKVVGYSALRKETNSLPIQGTKDEACIVARALGGPNAPCPKP